MKTPVQTRDAPTDGLATRSFQVRADTVDEQARTVEGVLLTENPVRVYDHRTWEPIDEILLIDGVQLPDQVPLLAVHDRWSLDSVLGSVRSIAREDGTPRQIAGRLHFADGDPDVDRVWNKVRQKHLRDLSVGYSVETATDIEPGQTAVVAGRSFTAGQLRLRVATAWILKETSVAPIGADALAKTRHLSLQRENLPVNPKLRQYLESLGLRTDATDDQATAFCAALGGQHRQRADALAQEVPPADPPAPAPAPDPPPADPPAPQPQGQPAPNAREMPSDADAARAEGRRLERERQVALREMAGTDVPPELLRQAIEENWDQARAAPAFLNAVRGARPAPLGNEAPAGHTRSREADCTARALGVGLMLRCGLDPVDRNASQHRQQEQERDADAGDRYRDISLADVCRHALRLAGRPVPEGRSEIIHRASSTAELADIFTTSVNAALVASYQAAPDTTALWTQTADKSNFMTNEVIKLERMGQLTRLPRGGAAAHATQAATQETYKIARYAKQFQIDEQDIVDDRLDVLGKIPGEMGEAAGRMRPDLVYAILLANAAMADTGALFNATAVTTAGGHANLTTAVLGAAGLRAGLAALATQRDGNVPLNLRPAVCIVPPALEFLNRELLTSAQIQISYGADDETFMERGTRNVLADLNLLPIVEGRLDATGVLDPRTDPPTARAGSATNWILAANRRTIEVGYLTGSGRSPKLTSWSMAGTDGKWGVGYSVKLDIGAVAVDFVGLHRSAGTG